MLQRLVTGRIVWTNIADANGIVKVRPAVIVTPTARLSGALAFDVVAISSRLPKPLPEDHVLLPWHPTGHPRTGLNRNCAAVCTWLAQIKENDIQDVAGLVPTAVMNTILDKIAAAIPPPLPPPSEEPLPPKSPGEMH